MRWAFWKKAEDTPFARQGEQAAERFLRDAGYTILDRNVRLGRYEIDILAREGGCTVFVEVKTRRTDDPVRPEESVGHTKRRHIVNAARLYASQSGEPGTNYRFDVVAVVLPEQGTPRIRLLRDAFPAR